MKEEMKKIEDEFAFQEKWINVFKRGTFLLQAVPEETIQKIMTKMKDESFFDLLCTNKWMFLLGMANRSKHLMEREFDYEFEHEEYDHYGYRYSEEEIIEVRQKLANTVKQQIRTGFNFKCKKIELDSWKESFFWKNYRYFRKIYCTTDFLKLYIFNPQIVTALRARHLYYRGFLCKKLKEYSFPNHVERCKLEFYSISEEDYFNMVKRFGACPLEIQLKNSEVSTECGKLLQAAMQITQERHNHQTPLDFITYKIYNGRSAETSVIYTWPDEASLPQKTDELEIYIAAKSEDGVTVTKIKRVLRRLSGRMDVTLGFVTLKTFKEWLKYEKNAARFKTDAYLHFCKSIADKYFQNGKLVYPPLLPPEPAGELVEFLKDFDDYDIQPEKLEPHKPKWRKTEKLPEMPRKLPAIGLDLNQWLIEAKEVIKLRKFWMDFLQKKKFILELIPEKNLLDIAKRIHSRSFGKLFRSSKWVQTIIDNSNIKIHMYSARVNYSFRSIGSHASNTKNMLLTSKYFYFHMLELSFYDTEEALIKMLKQLKDLNVQIKCLYLFRSPLIQEVFSFLKCGELEVTTKIEYPRSIIFPPELKSMEIFELDKKSESALLPDLFGSHVDVLWRSDNEQSAGLLMKQYLKKMGQERCRNNIKLQLEWSYQTTLFSPLDNSETVYVFRSMARGRGGIWKYFIRMEKTAKGAVGAFLFCLTSHCFCHRSSKVLFEYFDTMQSFLDFFEAHCGEERAAKDWMKLSQRDKTVEPTDKNFCGGANGKPFIHFDEQKEANDFEEVRKRCFNNQLN